MFFPYKDENPRVLIPYVTYGLMAANILVFIYHILLPDPVTRHLFTLRYGLIPAHLWGTDLQAVVEYNRNILEQIYAHRGANVPLQVQFLPAYITLFTSPFVHGGWLHILGNMLFLYVFADNVEGALGHVKFIIFYLMTALVAGLLHSLVANDSMLPVVGASGAISGVLGAYLIRYPKARVHVLIFIVIFFTTVRLPAIVVLGWWFLIQAVNGMVSLQAQLSGGVAWFEHIGGFIAGFSYMAILGRRSKLPTEYG